MKNETKKVIVSETYNDLRDYMQKNGYSALAVLEQPNHTNSNEELYGTEVSDVNYALHVVNI